MKRQFLVRGALLRIALRMVLAVAVLTGCSPRLSVTISPSSQTNVQLAVSPGTKTRDLIRSLSGSQALLNTDAVRETFLRSGYTTASAFSGDGISLTIDATARTAENAFSTVRRAITYTAATKNTGGSCTILISALTMPELLELLPPETGDYLSLLMAPVFTGEVLSESDYLQRIAITYGETIAAELRASVFDFTFTAPASITGYNAPPRADAAKVNANMVRFVVPLSTVLTGNETSYRVQWK